MLMQVLGEKPKVLLKSEFDNMASPKLDNAAVVVNILTQDFIKSGLIIWKPSIRLSKLPAKVGIGVFKVFKTPLSLAEQPPRLRELIGYEMYQIDTDSGEVREYTDDFSTEAERQYWMKMVDLRIRYFWHPCAFKRWWEIRDKKYLQA